MPNPAKLVLKIVWIFVINIKYPVKVAVDTRNFAITISFQINAPLPLSIVMTTITHGEIINKKNNSIIFCTKAITIINIANNINHTPKTSAIILKSPILSGYE